MFHYARRSGRMSGRIIYSPPSAIGMVARISVSLIWYLLNPRASIISWKVYFTSEVSVMFLVPNNSFSKGKCLIYDIPCSYSYSIGRKEEI